MNTLTTIKHPITNSFSEFEQLYSKLTDSLTHPMDDIVSHIDLQGGKHIRPILTLLSAGLFSDANEKTVKTAVALELLHNTTLIHDDIVDVSPMRRGKQTLHTIEGNKIAVLMGDYLYSQVLNTLTATEDMEIIRRVSQLTEAMGAGELQQQYATKHRNSSLSEYYNIIEKKTARLLSLCCELGAYSAGASAEDQKRLANFGLSFGMAFQIKDDILDFVGTDTGKQSGNDIREQKLTLPLLHFFETAEKDISQKVYQQIYSENIPQSGIEFIIEAVVRNGSIAFAEKKQREYLSQTEEQLASLPQTPCKQSLETLTEYMKDRPF